MREIKFRGKRIDNGEWVYGSYSNIPEPNIMFINEESEVDCEPVDPETVGQFTGLKDRNGKEIYDGDILDHYATVGYVIFEDGMFTLSSSAKVNFGHRQPLCYIDTSECEVIGNIFEDGDLFNDRENAKTN